jgi:hypothetical protein
MIDMYKNNVGQVFVLLRPMTWGTLDKTPTF